MPAKQPLITRSLEGELTARQQAILERVVEEYVATRQPVGSKSLVERSELAFSASTVRSELAELEARGLLTHPHTSAGRVPTERGYRLYVDLLLDRIEPRPSPFPLNLTAVRSEVEAALQTTTEVLSELTRLFALVSAPPLESTTVRHVEVLLLQPQLVMVVVITSTGGVSKRLVRFAERVDPGLAAWALAYLNERVSGLQLGTHLLRQRFEDPGLAPAERGFLARLRPAFTELVREEQRLFVGGAASLLDHVRAEDLAAFRSLFEVLEKRAALLELVSETLDLRRPFVRVGGELENPAFREAALVGAPYGLANRALGTVSLLGPVRMNYDLAIRSVRGAAFELSRFVEDVYADN
jgi:heat-inducible transcriptional repressor